MSGHIHITYMEETMDNVFNNPAELAQAILDTVNPQVIIAPSIEEQLTELIRPGRTVAFRTESGSFYELVIYTNKPTTLVKIDEETDGIKEVAHGTMEGIRDRKRGVSGISIKEPSGRRYTTSAVVKVWLSYDATIGSHGKSYNEPI